jgi:hypothetical protein
MNTSNNIEKWLILQNLSRSTPWFGKESVGTLHRRGGLILVSEEETYFFFTRV